MGKKRGHKGGSHANHERWLLTYADLITLLLIYFIILFSMSSIDANKFKKLADAMATTFTGIPTEGGGNDAILPPASDLVIPPVAPMYAKEESEFEDVADKVEKLAEQLGASASFDVHVEKRGLVISIADTALFPAGSADLDPKTRAMLGQVAALAAKTGNSLRIEGHTDNTPIRSARFPSNWELSTARATSVVRHLVDNGLMPPARVSAAGYGETYPKAPNDSLANRARNRRVDIVVLSDATMKQEPKQPAPGE
ncbi:MAG: OmpA family protein [Candidatus Sericytochromatia bacterium]|nr:OmpA family protein [Candidatus Sericytochromatia bacterium]